MSPQGNKKLLYVSLLLVSVILLVSAICYYRQNGSSGSNKMLGVPPLWYGMITPTALKTTGATTGFNVKLERFRKYEESIALKERPSQPILEGLTTDKCEGLTKWAVITTIAAEPTLTMNTVLEKMPEYCLVVVGDRKSPASYTIDREMDKRFVFLSIDAQELLPLEIIALTPENAFPRKNIGFMFAIANGAKVILDMDDDNVPIELEGKYIPIVEEVGSFASPVVDVEQEGHVWNPYPYYGALEAWPRGYPLDRIVPLKRELKTREVKCLPVVQQFMANRDPDVDAIYRLSHPLPMDFEADRKRMVLPHSVMCPYNAQATIHLSEAFWSMLLPKTVNGRVCDIWRSYITQYVLAYTDNMCLMFAPPGVRHERNSHAYLKDFYSEIPLYMLASQLVEMFTSISPQTATLEVVFRNIYVMLYEHGVLEEEDVKYVIAWINDLNKVGYNFPKF